VSHDLSMLGKGSLFAHGPTDLFLGDALSLCQREGMTRLVACRDTLLTH
jgi:hypothetical protein